LSWSARRRKIKYEANAHAVIGSKLFVQSVAAELYGAERARKRRYVKGVLPETETAIFSLRCLREDLIGPPPESKA
jgi:hypothetical protein